MNIGPVIFLGFQNFFQQRTCTCILPAWISRAFWCPRSGSRFPRSAVFRSCAAPRATSRITTSEHGLGLKEIQDVIAQIDPLPGAKEFLDELRAQTQAIIVSDTFEEFAQPLMKKLGWPTIFCNSLEIDKDGMLCGIRMRCAHSKLTTVRALQSMGFETIASGDSYNDLEMILASKAGFLFRSTDKIKADYPQLPAFETYDELLNGIKAAMA